MPKQKSHRGAAKRFSFTASGKIKRGKAFTSHQPHLKTTKRTRHLRKPGLVSSAEAKTVKKMLPYQ
ncbi:MAG: 50S ribosomal protein L35 [Christensenellaceae bacterium]|jgi:large subunit ribosomal protein L35|nr:50S ribosomal protein L35 [Christensenellaceae bacterium]